MPGTSQQATSWGRYDFWVRKLFGVSFTDITLTPRKALILVGARWTLSFSTYSTFCVASRDDRYGQSLRCFRYYTTSHWKCQIPPTVCWNKSGLHKSGGIDLVERLGEWLVAWGPSYCPLARSQRAIVSLPSFGEVAVFLWTALLPQIGSLRHKWRITWRFDHWTFISFQNEVFACFIE